jgi:hypothetical protein
MNQENSAAARATAYRELWGEPANVIRQSGPQVPPIDICVYGPRMDHNGIYQAHSTLVTTGMSDLAMTFPPDSKPPFHRAELVMYVPAPSEEHFRLLQFLAHYPHDARRYYVYGHTIPNAQPFFSNSEVLSVALLLQSLVRSDARLPELLRIEGQPVELLWVQPITAPEAAVKRQRGIDALLGLFAQHRLPFVLDERRPSLV